MAGFMYEVFSEPEWRKYKAPLCSLAIFVSIGLHFLAVIMAFYTISPTSGPWKKNGDYEQEPIITFKDHILLKFYTPQTYYIATTYDSVKIALPQNQKALSPSQYEIDVDNNGIFDSLKLLIPVYFSPNDEINRVEVFLVFDFQLRGHVVMQMESLVYVDAVTGSSVSGLSITGELALQQKTMFVRQDIDLIYNSSVIDATSVYPEDFTSSHILQNYNIRNVTTYLAGQNTVWSYGHRAAGQPFVLKANIRYPTKVLISAFPAFWEEFLYAFVKFIPIYIFYYVIIDTVLKFMFQHQIVASVIERPQCKL